jgi:hypothetical protein
MEDTPGANGKMVRATFTGGNKKILLIAHWTRFTRAACFHGNLPYRR